MIRGLDHINIVVSNIDEEVARLRQAGIAFLSEVQTFARTGKKLVYFYGPDAILLELAEYPSGPAAGQAEAG